MQILVSPDDQVCCDGELIQRIEGVLEGGLERFASQLTRIEVRLHDLDSENIGDRDKICAMEAQLPGVPVLVARHEASTLTEAIHGAAAKLKRVLERHFRERQDLGAARGLRSNTADPRQSGEGLGPESAVVGVDS